ncbi:MULTISPECIES: cobalamin-binding protein [Burkholderiaceae]|uniref:cobalamin-binding protein n=1 Tax=Burkholderiaceae TaxID=119060 RepID=UPI000961EE99|nr:MULTISPECIES: cobalamin-binding protein [Burkholderiaceae]MCF2133046.1 cobalamin-binding protein [Mycetohabitans sp. B3]MCG1038500.1 cobalamin-binding protein [Mycetohabitans sp. B7]SIT80164.1 iron complex transport system substrate-binding protein [Burkholderia sp. b14]
MTAHQSPVVRPQRRTRRASGVLVSLLLALSGAGTPVSCAAAPVQVLDDSGARVTLNAPARRVVSLAPSITELIYAAGGGSRLVGTVSFSDYPSAARDVPVIGSNTTLDLERIAATHPDLIVVWWHGNPQRQVERLKSLHVPLFYSEPHRLADISSTLIRLGTLLGTEPQAREAARAFDARIAALQQCYASRPPVSVFFQVWDDPLMTLNGTHIISDVLSVCGGRNLFGSLSERVPTVSTEAVIAVDPDAIIATRPEPARVHRVAQSTDPSGDDSALRRWQRWPGMRAVARDNLFTVDADLISRPGPRLADATALLCQALEQARQRAPARNPDGLLRP